jgi:hypothetical protein
MRTLTIAMAAATLAASLAVAAPASDTDVAVKGTWSLNNWTSKDDVQLTLTYRKGSTRWQWSTGQRLTDLAGLSKNQLHAMSSPAEFTLRRDSGVFFFKGTLMLGVGKGEFGFLPDPTYAEKLSAMGYADVQSSNASLMFMAVREISLEYAAEVKRLGIANLSLRDLERFMDHGIDLDFLRELVAAGYPGLTGENVVRLRDHGIDGAYVARVQASGFTNLTVDQIVRLHDHGVD